MLPLLFAFVTLGLMWALVIAPQQRRVKAHNAFVASLEVDMDVVTTSGMCGRVIRLDDDLADLEVAPGIVVQFDRRAIGALRPDPTTVPDAASETETGLVSDPDHLPPTPAPGTEG